MKIKYLLFIATSLIVLISCDTNSKSENLDFIKKEQIKPIENLNTSSINLLPSISGNDRIYFVNRNGNDPFSTFRVSTSITEALKNIEDDMEYYSSLDNPFSYKDVTLIIQAGIYGTESNETYPLVFPENIHIKGEGNVTIQNLDYLDGSMDNDIMNLLNIIFATEYDPLIILGDNTIVDFLTINAGDGIGVLIENNASAVLKKSTILNSKIGIRTKDNSSIVIMSSKINSNYIGIETGDTSKAIIKGVKIFDNQIGIRSLQSSKLQFIDKNSISNNKNCGLYDKGVGFDLILSDQIEWEVPIVYDICQGGVSIASEKNRNIIFQTVYDNIKLFSNVAEINLTYPAHKSSVTTTTPNIKWIPTPDNINTTVVIFNSLPIVNKNKIINKEDVVWYWDSNSNTKNIGNLKYSDGVSKGSLLNGKGYYYVVMEKDKSQTKVTAASPVYFFTINGNYTK